MLNLCSGMVKRSTAITLWFGLLLCDLPVWAQQATFTMPDIENLLTKAMEHGEIRVVVGQRHYSGMPVLGWGDNLYPADHNANGYPVFHAYGFGGSGLTLAPAVAEHIADQVIQRFVHLNEDRYPLDEVVVLGAGYTGILAATEIRKQLDANQFQNVPVKIIAHSYPEGSSAVINDIREPSEQDNYSSRTAGGWIMPVSIEPLADTTFWCNLITRAHNIWYQFSQTPPLSTATHSTTSLVFYDQFQDEKVPEDKSGIRTVNSTCPLTLYPERPVLDHFQSAAGTPFHYEQVVAFDNVIQTDTVSVLRYFIEQLVDKNVQFIQTDKLLVNADQLFDHLDKRSSVIVNASGNGACDIFGGNCQYSTPVRGDLVILKVPVRDINEHTREISRFTYWANGSHYLFPRYSLDGQWLELVMGGTFLENDGDLHPRTETVRHILNFWLNFFHQPPVDANEEFKQTELVDRIVNHIQSGALNDTESP